MMLSYLWPHAPDDLPPAYRRALHVALLRSLRPGSKMLLDPACYQLRIWMRPQARKLAIHWHNVAGLLLLNGLLMLHAQFMTGAAISVVVGWLCFAVGIGFKQILGHLQHSP